MDPAHKTWVDEWVATKGSPLHAARLEELITWIGDTYPQLEAVIKWRQPMFLDHGVFICGINAAKGHISLAPEVVDEFREELDAAGYNPGKKFIRLPLDKEWDWELIGRIIDKNISDKKDMTSFWR